MCLISIEQLLISLYRSTGRINHVILVVIILLKLSNLCIRHPPGTGLLPFVPSIVKYNFYVMLCQHNSVHLVQYKETRGIFFQSGRSRPPCSPVRWREMVHSCLQAYLLTSLPFFRIFLFEAVGVGSLLDLCGPVAEYSLGYSGIDTHLTRIISIIRIQYVGKHQKENAIKYHVD